MLVGGISSLHEPQGIREVFWHRPGSQRSARSSRITFGLSLQGSSHHVACHLLA